MTEKRDFHLGDILSVTTGRLVSPRHVDGVYDLLGFMVGEPLWTHQIPRVAEECAGPLLAKHPQLVDVQVPAQFDGKEHVLAWLEEQVAKYGEMFPVTPLPAKDHTSIDPLTELRMMCPEMKIVPVIIEGESS
jgi:hypothetical protein